MENMNQPAIWLLPLINILVIAAWVAESILTGLRETRIALQTLDGIDRGLRVVAVHRTLVVVQVTELLLLQLDRGSGTASPRASPVRCCAAPG